jgi:hypothetical protein
MPEGSPYRNSPYTIMEDVPPLQVESPQVPVQSPTPLKNNNSYSGVGFGSAFADARRKGLKTFEWYNPKTKRTMSYTTKLKEEVQRKESPMTTYKQRGGDSIMNTYNRREQKPISNSAIILSVNDKSNGDPVKRDMSGFKYDGNMPLPPTMQNRPGQREFSNKLANDLVVAMGTQAATMGLGGLINTITQGSKGMLNAYQVANTSRKGLAPGMKALGYESGTGQIPGNVDKLIEMITTGTNAGREALQQRELFNFLNKTIKYGQSLK